MNEPDHRRPRRRANIALVGFLAVAGYFLWTEHRAHVIEALPWVLVLGCLAMHFFMHRAHGPRGSAGSDADTRDRDTGEDAER